MTDIENGSIELHMKVGGKHYALALKLEDFNTESALTKGLRVLQNTTLATLRTLKWFPRDAH